MLQSCPGRAFWAERTVSTDMFSQRSWGTGREPGRCRAGGGQGGRGVADNKLRAVGEARFSAAWRPLAGLCGHSASQPFKTSKANTVLPMHR